KQQYSQHGGVRPFGSALLIIGVDPDGIPRVMTTSPSGTYWAWKGTAMGRNAEDAREKLNKVLKDDMTFDDLIKTGIKILREATEEDIEDETIQVGCVNIEDKHFRILSPEDTKPYLA
ncbi:MAG: archaeal proteasome endopeptidase complex subunit alpha, partial [Promethearchaeota archaeon]